MPTSTVTYDFKTALLAAAQAAINDPVVTYSWGEPDVWTDDVVLLGRSASRQSPATLGTNRSREETLSCELHVLVSRFSQVEAETRAYAMLGLIERSCRMVDSTLGGIVRQCFMESHEAEGYQLDDDRTGRHGVEIIATFVAHVRVSG